MKRRHLLQASALGVTGLAAGAIAAEAVAQDSTGADSIKDTSRPFPDSDPYNTPVGEPDIADDSDALIEALLGGTEAAPVIAITHFGASILHASSSTPRFTVVPSYTGDWGDNPFDGVEIPWDESWHIPPGDDGYVDGWVVIIDGDTSYELWQTEFTGGQLRCSWGDITNLSTTDGSSTPLEDKGRGTGANFSCHAGRITAAEWTAGVIDHALGFGCEIANSDFVYPATASDGGNEPGPGTIPEGTRIWLDTEYNVDDDDLLRPYERIVAKALQTYGAYCGDNAGSFGFGGEYADDATADDAGEAARSVGITGDYPRLDNIPWRDHLRILKPAR